MKIYQVRFRLMQGPQDHPKGLQSVNPELKLTNSALKSKDEHSKQLKMQEDRFDIFGTNVAIVVPATIHRSQR